MNSFYGNGSTIKKENINQESSLEKLKVGDAWAIIIDDSVTG